MHLLSASDLLFFPTGVIRAVVISKIAVLSSSDAMDMITLSAIFATASCTGIPFVTASSTLPAPFHTVINSLSAVRSARYDSREIGGGAAIAGERGCGGRSQAIASRALATIKECCILLWRD